MKPQSFVAAVVLAVATVAAPLPAVAAEAPEKQAVAGRDAFTAALVADQPIDMNLDVKGVKMQSVYFSGTEAMVIMWNRRPKTAKVNVDVVLFDAAGKVIAVGKRSLSLAGGSIRAGKQSNFSFDFGGYVAGVSDAAKFTAVFSVLEDAPESQAAAKDE